MKQKVVVKVSMNCQKSRSKALKIAVSVSGVESASLGGQDKGQVEVVGEGVDAVELTTRLRKNVGYAELVTVSALQENKHKEAETGGEQKVPEVALWPNSYGDGVPHYVYEFKPTSQYPDPYSCSIM